MSFHSCWCLRPPVGAPHLPVSEALARLAEAFPVHEFDPEAARADAAKRVACLIALNTPEAIIRSYQGEPPVRVWLAKKLRARHILQFDLWPGQGVVVSFGSAQHHRACFPLLERIADVLGYKLTEDTEAS